ncbi:MAG: hypothetical protein HZR80_12615 [Candidatus Heimdallarchaeota archaeon]
MGKIKTHLIISLIILNFVTISSDFDEINLNYVKNTESEKLDKSIQFTEISRFDDNYGYPFKFQVNNDIAYIASIDGLLLLDVSLPSSPSFLGFYDSEGSVSDVEIKDNLAFLASSGFGLEIIDITNPSNPVFISKCDDTRDVVGIYLEENIAYLACGKIDLKIVDISTLESPFVIEEFRDPNDEPYDPYVSINGFASEVIVKDEIALIADYEDGINIIDVQDPTSPLLLTVNRDVGAVMDFCYQENLLVVTDYVGMTIYDISNPINLVNLSSYQTNWTQDQDVWVDGDTAYIAQSHHEYHNIDDIIGGLEIVNISNPQNPFHIDKIELKHTFYQVYAQNGLAFLNEDNNFLKIVNASAPETPVLSIFDFGGSSQYLTKKNNTLFVVELSEGLEVLDISDINQPTKIGQLKVDHLVRDIVVSDNYAFTKIYNSAEWEDNLMSYSIKNLSNPSVVGHYPNINVKDFAIQNSYLYLSGNDFRVYEIKDDPFSIIQKDSLLYISGYFAVDGEYAYLFDDYVLNIIDVSNPDNLIIKSIITLDGRFGHCVAAKNGLAIVSEAELVFVDVSDPLNPKILSEYEISYYQRTKIEIYENLVFALVEDYHSGYYVEIFNIYDPEKPVKIAELRTTNIYDFTFDGEYIYLVEGFEGLKIVEISGLPIGEPHTGRLKIGVLFSVPIFLIFILIYRRKVKK